MNVSHFGVKLLTPSCFLREGTMSWAVSTTTTGACGSITSTMSASGRRKSRGTLLEMKRAFSKTTGWPAVSNGRFTSPERKHLWTYTCRGITCLHGDLPYKASGRASASSLLSVFLVCTCLLHYLNFFLQVPSRGMTSTARPSATTWSVSISMRTSSCLPQPTRPSTHRSAYCS